MSRRYKVGKNREQADLFGFRLDDYVGDDNPVRAIDIYVDGLDLVTCGFTHTQPAMSDAGQPPYPPQALLKLYLYGYLNRTRSSRRLESEARRNVELMWLLEQHQPCYKTIADFRKDNAKAMRRVQADFILLCKELGLYGGQRIGVDGSHFKGNVSTKSFQTEKKLSKKIAALERQIAAWYQSLDEADCKEASEHPSTTDPKLQEKLEQLKQLQKERNGLKERGKTQHSSVDEDARLLSKRSQKVAGYNVQIAVDSKHKLLVADQVTNDSNDLQQLHPMSAKAKAVLAVDSLEVLADAGYYSSAQIHACHSEHIIPYVAEPSGKRQAQKEGRFGHDDFCYDAEQDRFRCPGGRWLLPSGKPRLQNNQLLQRYVSSQSDCHECQLRGKCLSAKSQCREVWRGEYEADIQAVRQRMAAFPRAMAERSATVEHPFGTLKRRAGWDHFLVRGLEKVRGEWSLMALAYNFSRVLKLLGFDRFREICAQRAAKPAESRSTDHYWRLRKDGSNRFSEAFTRSLALFLAYCHMNAFVGRWRATAFKVG